MFIHLAPILFLFFLLSLFLLLFLILSFDLRSWTYRGNYGKSQILGMYSINIQIVVTAGVTNLSPTLPNIFGGRVKSKEARLFIYNNKKPACSPVREEAYQST